MPLRIFRSRTVQRGERRPGADGRRACSGCSSSARCTCSACSATTRSRSAWRSCPSRWRSGSLSLGASARLITALRRGRDAAARARAHRGGPRALRAGAGRREYAVDLLPVDAAARHRRRAVVPVADDARHVGRDAERRRPRLGPHQHERAGRRRARPRGPGDAVDDADRGAAAPSGAASDAALVDGYRLAFWIAAGLVAHGGRRGGHPASDRAPLLLEGEADATVTQLDARERVALEDAA